jgi:hypothetical protein
MSARGKCNGRAGLIAASTPLIAQYAPKIPKETDKIAVLLTRKATNSASTFTSL